MHLLNLLWVAIFMSPVLCRRCDSLNNVLVNAKDDTGKKFKEQISGCIERRAFGDRTVVRADMKGQTVPRIGPDTVRNMIKLHAVNFDGCKVETIEPGAFRNLPSVREIRIVENPLKMIPKGVFQNLTALDVLLLSDNKIETISDEAFADMPSLEVLQMFNNRLARWDRNWFRNSPGLISLDFQWNKIKTLPNGAFSRLSKLKTVLFNCNELEVIEADAFNGVTHLEELGLRSNKLRSIASKAFPNRIMVNLLNLAVNRLNFLPKMMMENVKVKQVVVFGNPWKCPCWHKISSWLFASKATIKSGEQCTRSDVPVCSYPDDPEVCVDTEDVVVTKRHFNTLKALKLPLTPECFKDD